jgi:outer membrane lipoprotein-sorting protein
MRKVLLLLICAAVSQGAVHGASAVEIARRARSADELVSYRGTKAVCVTVNGKSACSVIKVVHMRPDMTRKEYFSPSECAGMIVIGYGSDTWKYDPHSRLWEQVHSLFLKSSDGVFDNYDVQLVGSESVAGRDAYVIKAVPKHAGDSLHKVWVDKKSYVMLRTQVQTAAGTALSSSKFTTIAIEPGDISRAAFAVAGKVRNVSAPASVDFVVRRPSYLPRGYKMVGLANAIVTAHVCAHLQFSNGVDTISLFERKSDRGATELRTPRRLTTMMTWARGGVLYTLVGDISRLELHKIATSIK